MKLRNLLLSLGLLSSIALCQTTPVYFTVANRYDQIVIPTGQTLTGQYGCTGNWIAVTLPPGSYPVYAGGLPGVSKDPPCTTFVLQILELTSAQSVVDISSVYSAAGVLTSTSTPVVIPSNLPPVTPPPANTVPFPISGTKACTMNWTLAAPVPPATSGAMTFTFTCP